MTYVLIAIGFFALALAGPYIVSVSTRHELHRPYHVFMFGSAIVTTALFFEAQTNFEATRFGLSSWNIQAASIFMTLTFLMFAITTSEILGVDGAARGKLRYVVLAVRSAFVTMAVFSVVAPNFVEIPARSKTAISAPTMSSGVI